MVAPLVLGWMLLVHPAHPMHTSVAELKDSAGVTIIRIRVFEDDFTAALGSAPTTGDPDSAMSRYVLARFALADRTGQAVPLRWEAAERTGGVWLLQLIGSVPGGLAGARVKSALLCDRFADQVNIVRASYGGHSSTLLFTPGDGAKALP